MNHQERAEMMTKIACDQLVTETELAAQMLGEEIATIDAEVLTEAEAMTRWAAETDPEFVAAAMELWAREPEEGQV